MLGIKPKVSSRLIIYSATELHPNPLSCHFQKSLKVLKGQHELEPRQEMMVRKIEELNGAKRQKGLCEQRERVFLDELVSSEKEVQAGSARKLCEENRHAMWGHLCPYLQFCY